MFVGVGVDSVWIGQWIEVVGLDYFVFCLLWMLEGQF